MTSQSIFPVGSIAYENEQRDKPNTAEETQNTESFFPKTSMAYESDVKEGNVSPAVGAGHRAPRVRTPQINPNNMYWPPYDFTAPEGEKELKVKYTQEIIKFAVLSPEEWKAFFDTLDVTKTVKDTATGLYDARETAKALGGIGVTAFVRNVDGTDYLILKNYDKWSQSLLYGGVFRADKHQVVKLGLGALSSVKGMARYVRVSAPMEILVGTGINVLQFILNDEYTLKKLGVDEAKIFVNILATSALALGAAAMFPVLASTALMSGVTLVVSSAVVWTVDKLTSFEEKLVNKVVELSN